MRDRPAGPFIGKNVKAIIKADLKLEIGAVVLSNEARASPPTRKTIAPAIFLSAAQGRGRAHALARAQLHQIAELGYECYLTTQTSKVE